MFTMSLLTQLMSMKTILIALLSLCLYKPSHGMTNRQDTINGNGISVAYERYLDWANTDARWKEKAATMTYVEIYNPDGILIASGEKLPLNGILFQQMEDISFFTEVKQLYIVNLHVEDISHSFLKLQKLERMEIAFTSYANIKHCIKVLGQLHSLKKIRIDSSTLRTKDRKAFITAMEKKGIHVITIFA
jgi:hypothetical protein